MPTDVTIVLGPLLTGTLLNTILFGICANQSFYYYRVYSSDPSWIRYFVLQLFIVELFNSVFHVCMTYKRLILDFGESAVPSVTLPSMMLIADPLILLVISTSTRFFTAWRIKANGLTIISVVIGVLTAVSLAGGISFAAMIAGSQNPGNVLLFSFSVPKIAWLSASALADLVVATTLFLSLRLKSPTKAHEDSLARLIRYLVHTGMLAAAVSTSDLLVALALHRTTISFVWDMVLSKIYVIALLTILNTRRVTTDVTTSEDNVLFGQPGQQIQANVTSASNQSHKRHEVFELGQFEGITVKTVVDRVEGPNFPNPAFGVGDANRMVLRR